MTNHSKHASSTANVHHHSHRHGPLWKRIHRDWRTWVVVALMLAAMLIYVMSDDESLQPGGAVSAPTPAAAGP